MPKRCQLLAPAQIDGEARPAGYIFMLADDVKGPHRTVGANGPEPRDEPLFIELPDDDPVEEEKVEPVALLPAPTPDGAADPTLPAE